MSKVRQVIQDEIARITYEIEDLRVDMDDVDSKDPHSQVLIAQAISDLASQLKALNMLLVKLYRVGGYK